MLYLSKQRKKNRMKGVTARGQRKSISYRRYRGRYCHYDHFRVILLVGRNTMLYHRHKVMLRHTILFHPVDHDDWFARPCWV